MTKTSHIILLAFLLLAATRASAQDSHVNVRYASDTDKTFVRTDWMTAIDTPQQFAQLILNASYKGKQLESVPDKVDLVIWSYTKEAKSKESKAPALLVRTDAESWQLIPQTYVVLKGETRDGQDIFWEVKRPSAGQPNRLPKNARLKSGADTISGIFMEQFFFQLKPEQLTKIAAAQTVELRLGEISFNLISEYQQTVRNFRERLDPASSDRNSADSIRQTNVSPGQKPTATVDASTIKGKVVSLAIPAYPLLARNTKSEGTVKVLVTIDETGAVVAARALSGPALLREPAEAAARASRFTPPIVSGSPVKVTGVIAYNFQL